MCNLTRTLSIVAGLLIGADVWAGTVVLDFDNLEDQEAIFAPIVEDGFVIDPALAPSIPVAVGGNETAIGFCG